MGQNQQAFLAINRANGLLGDREHDVYMFYKEVSNYFVKFAGLSSSFDRMYHFDGPVIATDFDLARFLLKTYTPTVKVLYLFNLDWIHNEPDYLQNIAMLNNPNLLIIAPSNEYANEVFNYSGRVVNSVIPRFDLLKIIKVIEDEICRREQN